MRKGPSKRKFKKKVILTFQLYFFFC